MPKIVDKGSYYSITDTGAENLAKILIPLIRALGERRENRTREKKLEVDVEENQADLLTKLATLAKTDPEKANALKDSPMLVPLLDPRRAERLKHEGEGILKRFFHHDKDKFKEPPKPIADFEVSPQLKAQREEAAAKALYERTKAGAEVSKENMITRMLGSEEDTDQVMGRLLRSGAPVNAENFSLFAQPQTALAEARTKDPYSKESIQAAITEMLPKLQEEFGTKMTPLQLKTYARSVLDPNFELPAGFKVPANLAERTQALAAQRLHLDTQRFDMESTIKVGEMAKYLLQNSEGGVTSENAMGFARQWMRTGDLPVPLPKDKAAEADLLYRNAQTAETNQRIVKLKAENPKFSQLLDLITKMPEGDEKNAKIQQAYKLWKEKWGVADTPEGPGLFSRTLYNLAANGGLGPLGVLGAGLAVGDKNAQGINPATGLAKAGGLVKGGAEIAGGLVSDAAHAKVFPDIKSDVAKVLGNAQGSQFSSEPLRPEVVTAVKGVQDVLARTLASPGLPPGDKAKIMDYVKRLRDAYAANNNAALLSLIQEISNGGSGTPGVR